MPFYFARHRALIRVFPDSTESPSDLSFTERFSPERQRGHPPSQPQKGRPAWCHLWVPEAPGNRGSPWRCYPCFILIQVSTRFLSNLVLLVTRSLSVSLLANNDLVRTDLLWAASTDSHALEQVLLRAGAGPSTLTWGSFRSDTALLEESLISAGVCRGPRVWFNSACAVFWRACPWPTELSVTSHSWGAVCVPCVESPSVFWKQRRCETFWL